MCWMLWKNRNKYVFQHEIGRVEDTIRAAECFASNICEINCNRNAFGNLRLGMAKWRPPSPGWIKINTNGAANIDGNWLATGGVLRDFSGNWVKVFKVQNNGYNKVIIEIDCMIEVEIIKEGLGSMPSTTIVKKIKTMYRQFAAVKFQFVNWEENMIANWLARNYPSSEVNLVKIDIPSFHVRKLLLEDKLGDTHNSANVVIHTIEGAERPKDKVVHIVDSAESHDIVYSYESSFACADRRHL
ncbi:hypothetical protein J1N35_035793 [Gossypium stocksii]|uniref:RNase H type-1 domain-containing protein n=1 Tax=Gossypium stocksii TaxID=47602 RepID=A0A9D3ZRF1_9ROSI|nr:hypothetical protein J1N35_035793 [Gossypium stocksii]